MKRSVLLFVVFLSLGCLAQNAENTLPVGFRFPGQMINHLDARKAKVGDEVKLELTSNIDGPGGVVAIPKGAKFIGTITSVSDRKSNSGESQISFLITKAEWHGGSMTLHAVPDAVTAPRMGTQRSGDRSGQMAVERGSRSGGGDSVGDARAPVDTNAMIGQAIAQELKGTSAREVSDPRIAMALVNSKRDVSLPSGAVVTLRQVKVAE